MIFEFSVKRRPLATRGSTGRELEVMYTHMYACALCTGVSVRSFCSFCSFCSTFLWFLWFLWFPRFPWFPWSMWFGFKFLLKSYF